MRNDSNHVATKPVVKIVFFDVGQGDTIVISFSDGQTREAIVVDCKDTKAADAVLDYLKEEKIEYLRGIIITHFHEDHYGGIKQLLMNLECNPGMQWCGILACNSPMGISNKKVAQLLSRDSDGHSGVTQGKTYRDLSKTYRDLIQIIKKQRLAPKEITSDILLPFDGLIKEKIEVLHPSKVDLMDLESLDWKLNNTSVVLRIVGTESTALLMGDLEEKG